MLRNRVNTKVLCIAHEADTFLASENDRLDWNLDFHPNGHLAAISFKQHNSAQIRGSVRAFHTTCCVSSPQNDWACLYCLNIILSLQFIGQNATHIAHSFLNKYGKKNTSFIYCMLRLLTGYFRVDTSCQIHFSWQ